MHFILMTALAFPALLTLVQASAFINKQRGTPYYPRNPPMSPCYGRGCQPQFIDDAVLKVPSNLLELSYSENDQIMDPYPGNYMYARDDMELDDNYYDGIQEASNGVLNEVFGNLSNGAVDRESYNDMKRSHYRKVPCKCESKFVRHDLGIDYWPRYYVSEICNQQECWYGGQCREKYYNITVIRRRSPDKPEIHDTRIQKAPRPFRHTWISEHVKISVGCHCTLC